jgi:hypothetical protein
MVEKQMYGYTAICSKVKGGCGYIGSLADFNKNSTTSCPTCGQDFMYNVTEVSIGQLVPTEDREKVKESMITNFALLSGELLKLYFKVNYITEKNLTSGQKAELGL